MFVLVCNVFSCITVECLWLIDVCVGREELEKQQARVRYQELHQQGKTEEAQADLARLAIIRKKREEAAKKREEEKKGEYCSLHRKKYLRMLVSLMLQPVKLTFITFMWVQKSCDFILINF